MAKQIGLIKISGTIDGINFYKLKSEAIAREAGGGFNSERIKTAPEMKRVRENASEFGQCSTFKKTLRIALEPFYRYHKDTTLHSRMMTLLQGIKSLDESSGVGLRRVGVGLLEPEGQRLFRDFAFSPRRRLTDVLPFAGHFDGSTLSYSVTGFSADEVPFPAAATHVELLYGVLQMDRDTHALQLDMGEPLFIARDETLSSFALDAGVGDGSNVIRFAFAGVRFYEKVGSRMCILKDLAGFAVGVVG